MDVPEFGEAIDSEDCYQAYYRDINDVKGNQEASQNLMLAR